MIKTIAYILLYAVLNVSGASLIKWHLEGKSLETANEWLKLVFNIPFIVAFTLIVFSAFSFFKALSTSSFSLVIPIATGINFILTICIGYFLFHDRLSLMSFVGFFLIISGIIILSLNNQVYA